MFGSATNLGAAPRILLHHPDFISAMTSLVLWYTVVATL